MAVTRYRKTGPEFFALLRSLPGVIDDVLDTFYEPNASINQFLGPASMTFAFLFPFLASSCLVISCFSCLFFCFRSFFVFSLPCLFFSFLYDFFFPIDLRLSCVCVVLCTTCNIYVVVFLGWQAGKSVCPGASRETCAPVSTWHVVD